MSAKYKLTRSPEGIPTVKEAWIDELEKPEKEEREREREIQEYTRQLAELSARRLAEIAILKAQAHKMGEHAMFLQQVQERAEQQAKAASRELEDKFQVLAQRWHRETRYLSSANKMAMHPAYQKIISLGKNVIPLILCDLQQTRAHWLWALYILSDFEDPAPEASTLDEAIDAWLSWGKEHNHIS